MTELAVARRSRTPRSQNSRNQNQRTQGPRHQGQRDEDQELRPITGILDIRDEHGFVRAEGYLPSAEDAYVPPSVIRRNGLRWGDVISGWAALSGAADSHGRRSKHSPLTKLETVNGHPVDQLPRRPLFHELTPLYPQSRLRLETEPHILTTRVLDLIMPLGKGQRALIVSPPKAGKTMILQAIAHAITINHPEIHLMALLVDERPEEVTDMQRTLQGEVIASTFDRPPSDHIGVAELTIERAKRLVEQGKDVVILLDSITRMARAYNLAAPSNGRTMSGGIDSTALHAPKRFLGAARNIEGGGSLTIIATALVETGSAGDNVIFEEFKSTGNAEFRLMRTMADRRVFPAVELDSSGTRKEEILLAPDELAVTRKLRKALSAMDPQKRVEQLLDSLLKTNSNNEFLRQLARSTQS
jgi:transcription termination factor Rho